MLFLDTANQNEIKEAFSWGILKGVTTNPSILLKEKKDRYSIISEILSISTGKVFVQCTGSTYEEMYEDCTDILSIAEERIGLKIPANVEGIKLIRTMKKEEPDVEILATAIFSTEQAVVCAIAGCDYVAPYVNRMENNQINPYDAIKKMRNLYDNLGLPTKILGASFKNTNQVIDTLSSGAHTVTVSFDVLKNMVEKDLANASIQKFQADWEELQKLV